MTVRKKQRKLEARQREIRAHFTKRKKSDNND